MKRLLSVIIFALILVLSIGAKPSQAAFCDNHPSHWKCSSPTPSPVITPSPSPIPTATPTPDGYVTVCGLNLCDNGTIFSMYAASIYGTLDDPLGSVQRAKNAQLNTVRITNWMHEEINNPFDEWGWVRVDKYLDAVRNAGLKAVLDFSWYRNMLHQAGVDPYTQDWNAVVQFYANRINTVNGIRYADDPTISMIYIASEPDGVNGNPDPLSPTTQELTDFYSRTSAQFQLADTHHIINSGGIFHIDYDSGIDWRSIFSATGIDTCGTEDYSAGDHNTSVPNVANYCAQIGKPWIMVEFGMSQQNSDQTRANYFTNLIDWDRQYHAAGISFWNLGPELIGVDGKTDTYDVNPQTPLTWSVVQNKAP